MERGFERLKNENQSSFTLLNHDAKVCCRLKKGRQAAPAPATIIQIEVNCVQSNVVLFPQMLIESRQEKRVMAVANSPHQGVLICCFKVNAVRQLGSSLHVLTDDLTMLVEKRVNQWL